jgi:hypothetical protein
MIAQAIASLLDAAELELRHIGDGTGAATGKGADTSGVALVVFGASVLYREWGACYRRSL